MALAFDSRDRLINCFYHYEILDDPPESKEFKEQTQESYVITYSDNDVFTFYLLFVGFT